MNGWQKTICAWELGQYNWFTFAVHFSLNTYFSGKMYTFTAAFNFGVGGLTRNTEMDIAEEIEKKHTVKKRHRQQTPHLDELFMH